VGETCSAGSTWTTACGQTCVCGPRLSPVCSSCPSSSPSSCVASSGPGAGRECRFPFTWAGQTYTSCTPWLYGGAGQGSNWCSVATDVQGNHINGDGNFGYCPASCSQATTVSDRPGPGISFVNQRSNLGDDRDNDAIVFQDTTVSRGAPS